MKILRLILALALIAGMASPGHAAYSKRTAVVSQITGAVEVKAEHGDWIPAKEGCILNQGDSIRTKSDSSAVLDVEGVAEKATVDLKQNSQLRMAELLQDKDKETQRTLLDLSIGEILIQVDKLQAEKSSFEVKTPTSMVGVRGTTFSVKVETME
jgi:hypothetical protein